MAQQNYLPTSYRDFSGGLNDNAPAINLPPNESPNLLNVVIDEPIGALASRRGIELCGNLPSGNAPKSLFEYFKSDGTRRLIATDNQTYYETSDCRTYKTIISGLGATDQPSFAIVRDDLWTANGSTHVFVWNGGTTTLLDARANTPNPAPQRCRYLQFWKERVWCARSSGNQSGVAFSSLADAAGNLITPSTGTAAWPAVNLIQVDQNGGSPLYGLKVYKDDLFAFKNNGIWKVLFENEFDIRVVKTLSSVGTRFNDSIWEVDGILYFVGPDGIYAFTGDESLRISDKVLNRFQAVNQPLVSQSFKTWTSQGDFTGGTLSSTTATEVPGSVIITSGPAKLPPNGDFETGDISPFTCQRIHNGGFPELTACGITTSSPIQGVYSSSVTAACSTANTCDVSVFDLTGTTRTTGEYGCTQNQASTQTVDTSAYSGVVVRAHFRSYSTTGNDNQAHMYTSTFTAQRFFTWQQVSLGGCGSQVGWLKLDNFQTQQFFSSGTWTSEAFNAVTVSSWSTLDATSQNNSGYINYFVKVGSNTGALAQRSFEAITPGSVIVGTASQVFVQVRADLYTSANLDSSPRLDDITVSYFQGSGSGDPIFARGWKNRLWISASTGTADNNNIVFVKSKQPPVAFVPYDLQIGPMVNFNDRFYGGASTHSAIYRLDYGTDDNGAAITHYWESRDDVWQLPSNAKSLQEINLDFQNTGALNTQVGFSRDNGATFTDKTVMMPGSTRGTKRIFVNGGNATNFRFRIYNGTLGETFRIHGLEAYAVPYNFRQ